ncbi:MAG: hypothetical protein KDK90_06485 [Leptospiraceae bacterium]|nr:hypothetical protein [Leptospiraceae bacterium]
MKLFTKLTQLPYIYNTKKALNAILMMALCLLLVHLDTNFTGTIPQAMPQIVVDDNGKANASYPIEVPPGTKDVQPNLSLVYHSDEPDGLLGSSLPTISRDITYRIKGQVLDLSLLVRSFQEVTLSNFIYSYKKQVKRIQ